MTRRLLARLDALVDDLGDLRPVCLLRAFLGVVLLLHLRPDLQRDRTPFDRFNEPWWSWVPTPSGDQYRALLWLGVVLGVAMIIGLACRVVVPLACALVLYQMVADLTSFSHNRAFLTWLLFGLSLVPTDRWLAVDRFLPWGALRSSGARAVGLRWPVYLLRAIASLVYLSSGLSKWFDADWRSGQVLWGRVTLGAENIPFDGWLFDLLTDRAFYRVAAPVVLATEVAIGVGLWFLPTRRWAIALAVLFHISIEITASVQTFSYSAIAALLIWLPVTRSTSAVGAAQGRDHATVGSAQGGDIGVVVPDR